MALPPSLKNIYKELATDIAGFEPPSSGDLQSWASQGVLLLNAILTVDHSNPGSHKNFGWGRFTDKIIDYINVNNKNTVFILWGLFAQEKCKNIKKVILILILCFDLSKNIVFY